MNDFTKKELNDLRASRCYHMDDSYPSNDKLFMKLQSLIDNYCEHENTEFMRDIGIDKCKLCGVCVDE